MPTTEELRAKWKSLRSDLGNLICQIDGKIENLKDLDASWQKGYDCGYQDGGKEAYECGLEEAWAAAKRIVGNSGEDSLTFRQIEAMFGTRFSPNVFRGFTAIEAVQKLRELDDKTAQEKRNREDAQALLRKYGVLDANNEVAEPFCQIFMKKTEE